MNIGLYFGSFNPIHNGHLAIADFLKKRQLFDQIWLVVSPNNPLKDEKELLPQNHRLNMVKLAIQNLPYLRACDVEFSLSTPSYSINTLNFLKTEYPHDVFSLILGADIIENFHQWKNYEEILNRYKIYVYPRTNNQSKKIINHPNINYMEAPLLPVSSTEIRTLLRQNKPIAEFVPEAANRYILNNSIFLS